MNKKESWFINGLANWITIISGVIAISNFLYTLSHGMLGSTIVTPSVPAITLPFRLISFILLETALAYAFGWMLIKLIKLGKGVPAIMVWVVSLISAWTSLFNAQWLVLGIDSTAELTNIYIFWFVVLSAIAFFVALYFIDFHDEKEKLTEGASQFSGNGIEKLEFTPYPTNFVLSPSQPEAPNSDEPANSTDGALFTVIALAISYICMILMYIYTR